MGRCHEPVAGRRDPKRSPTGASIGIPQSGRRRLKNPSLSKLKCGAVGLRACGCRGSLAAEAALRHSDARPGGAALRMAPGASAGSRLMRRVWTTFMGRCHEPVAGRRDPKRSPTGASIGIPQSGRRRLKNAASHNRSAGAIGLRARGCQGSFFSRRGYPAPFRCSRATVSRPAGETPLKQPLAGSAPSLRQSRSGDRQRRVRHKSRNQASAGCRQ